MRAVRWHAAGDVRLEEIPEPVVGDGMVLVEIDRCGICGTDVGEYRAGPMLIRPEAHPLTGTKPPVVLGHELSGRVVEASTDRDLAPGTRVTVDACWRCGTCAACKTGNYHVCRYGGSIGLVSDGGFAELACVPDYVVIPLPDAVSDEQGAMAEPLAVGLHALDRGQVRPADDVVVLGFGPIGAAVALVARAIGARPVVIEASAHRRELAERLGLTVLDTEPGIPRAVRRHLGRLGADAVIECTGVPALLQEAISAADRGGRIVPVGLSTSSAQIDPATIVLYERSLVGSLGYRFDIERVVALMSSGALDPSPLVTETIGLEDVPATLGRLAAGAGESLKVMVAP